MVKHVFLIAGKRKCGKDFCCKVLHQWFSDRFAVKIVGVSYSLKRKYAKTFGLSYKDLLTEGSYKEKYREDMIKWGEEVRKKDQNTFCRDALRMADGCDILIISDCRRYSDMQFFKSQFPHSSTTIRIEASLVTRQERGFQFTKGIDDAESECGLDDYPFKYYLTNEGTEEDVQKFFGALESVEFI